VSDDLLTSLLANLPCVFGDEIDYLRNAGKTFKPETNVLMLGTGSGQMALLMHLGARENYTEPYPAKMFNFYTVDWALNGTYEIHMRHYGFDVGTVIAGKTWDVYSQFQDEFFDFIIVDACHWKQCVSMDIEAYWPKLKTGGLCFFHDFIKKETDNGVEEAINEHKNENWLEIARPGISIVYKKVTK
jgi:predicted O-methyltransferase YrrM